MGDRAELLEQLQMVDGSLCLTGNLGATSVQRDEGDKADVSHGTGGKDSHRQLGRSKSLGAGARTTRSLEVLS